MDRNEYIRLRKDLDFEPSYLWLLGHLAGDILLCGFPAAWLIAIRGDISFSFQDITLCAFSALSLSLFYFRSFSMMHEAVHGCLHQSRRLNDLAGLLFGAFCFLPFAQWREIHLFHHQWAGNVEKDPVMKLVLEFRKPPTRMRAFLSTLWRSWFPILALLQYQVFWLECASRFWKAKRGLDSLSMVLPLLLWAAVIAAAGWPVAVFVILPSALLYFALVEVINFPHHMNLPQYEGETKLSIWEQYKISRSCIYPKLFSHFVLLNFNYHTEHHLFPTLPWYRLNALSERLRRELPGYNFTLGNDWILENRGKSLEDVSKAPESSSAKDAA